jgi:hypothetical protein
MVASIYNVCDKLLHLIMKTNKSCFLLCREDDERHPGLHTGEDMSMVAAKSVFYEIVRNKDFNFSSATL